MAAPSITSVTPGSGPSGGMEVVRISGGNFRLPPAQPGYGPSVPQLTSTVSVFFGDEPATDVEVISASTLYCRTPLYQGAPVDDALPPVDVTVQNMDDGGAPIGGERATAVAAYAYQRPRIHAAPGSAPEPDSADMLVARALVLLLRRQVIANTVLTTHVDFAEPGVIAVNVAKVPALVVQGPTITRDVRCANNAPVEVDNGDGSVSLTRPPRVRQHAYTIIGVSDNEGEMLNMMASIETCFEAAKWLPVDLDPADPTKGRVLPVLQLTAQPQTTSTPSDSNIRTFVCVCEVRGIEVLPPGPTERAYQATEATIEAQESSSTETETIEVF